MISLESVPNRIDGYRIEEMDGELLLYNPQSTSTVYMNQTAALVWQLCDGQRQVDEIVEILVESFPDAQTDMQREVLGTLKSFHDNGALAV